VVKFGYNPGKKVNRENYSTKQVLFWQNFMEVIEKILSVIGKILLVIWKFYKWLFITSYKWSMVIFALIDLWLGDGSWWRDLTAKNTNAGNIERIKEQLPNMTLEELLKQFGDSLKELEENNQLTPEQQKVVRKVRRVSPSEIRSRIRDVLTEEEEMEILVLLILRLLGILR
jgi:hypothetical protein